MQPISGHLSRISIALSLLAATLAAHNQALAQNFPITAGQKATASQVAQTGIPVGDLLPNAPGTLYDRGKGAAAFDGLDVVAGQGSMVWGGALRCA